MKSRWRAADLKANMGHGGRLVVGAFQAKIWALAQFWGHVGVNALRNLHGKGVRIWQGPARPR